MSASWRLLIRGRPPSALPPFRGAPSWPPTVTTGHGRAGPAGPVPLGRQYLVEGAADYGGQLGSGEEVDIQPGLGPAVVPDREAAVTVLLEAPVRVLEVSAAARPDRR